MPESIVWSSLQALSFGTITALGQLTSSSCPTRVADSLKSLMLLLNKKREKGGSWYLFLPKGSLCFYAGMAKSKAEVVLFQSCLAPSLTPCVPDLTKQGPHELQQTPRGPET
jgi:hypothetical protein